MSLLLVGFVALLGVFLGKIIFKNWVNHLTLYSIIMGGLTFFYELKYLPYPDVVPIAWFFIIGSFLSYILGTLTVLSAKYLIPNWKSEIPKTKISLPIVSDGGSTLKYAVIFFSIVGIFVALHRWYVLVGMFGSIKSVLINAAVIYRMNVDGEIKDFIPILPAFVYVAVFLSGIYTAYKRKFSLLAFLPFIGIVLKELTYFGRAELLLTLLEFLFSFFLFRHLLNSDSLQRFKFFRGNAIISSVLLLVFLIIAASFIRLGRGSHENYQGATKELRELSDNMIISPSIYLYLSSDVGVFSKYLEKEKEQVNFGENTFFIFHVFLSRLGIIEKPVFFSKGYFIPMWTNTGTYLRELHADFGTAGVFLGPYFLGLIITWLWFKFYEKRQIYIFAILIYFFLIIGFSFLTLATKLNQWYISLFFILVFLPMIEKIAIRNSSSNQRIK